MRSVATAKGGQVGRPVLADPDKTARAVRLCDQGATISEIVAMTGVARTSLCRHLPPRLGEPITADGGQGEQRSTAG